MDVKITILLKKKKKAGEVKNATCLELLIEGCVTDITSGKGTRWLETREEGQIFILQYCTEDDYIHGIKM